MSLLNFSRGLTDGTSSMTLITAGGWNKILPGITIKVYMSKFLFLLIQYMTFFLVFLELAAAAAAAKSPQLCPTLCDPRDGSPPGSPVPGILQARTLEWVAISFTNA